MSACLICLADAEGEYHPACLRRLFATDVVPALEFELGQLYAVAAQMAGKMSISGIQEKVSLKLSADRTRLEIAESGGRYILKPEPARFSALPQNEHLTMRLAAVVGIETPPFGLMRLKDGSLAYLIKRFDRLDDGTKLAAEDFCQLAERPVRDKYNSSAERCVQILRKYASEPVVEISKLYRLLLFGWWSANGDMHLKNLTLLTQADGTRRLAPAYDLVCTQLVIPADDSLAMPLDGKNKNLTRRDWLDFGAYCKLPPRAVERIVSEQAAALEECVGLIRRSYLAEKMKEEYEAIVRGRVDVIVKQVA